jgi:hypothetical protein
MKRAVLTRSPTTDEGTFGMLKLDSGRDMHTIELPWRDNAPTISCIPKGKYLCEIVKSPKFGRVYEVKNVPKRSHILIHAGNWAGDKAKGFKSDLLGCIAPGDATARLDGQMGVIYSRRALHDLMAWGAGEPFELEIK